MNFLAHVYLSGKSDEIKVGNFIGDYVKGSDYNKYPDLIRKGILLHRSIDNFTDKHPVVSSSKKILYPRYRRYSGVIVDIFFDHFLTMEWDNFSPHPLPEFISRFYEIVASYDSFLPREIKYFLPTCISEKWASSYGTIEGIKKTLIKMGKRTSLPGNAHTATEELEENYEKFREYFVEFFPLMINFVEKKYNLDLEYPQTGYLKESG